MLGASAPIGMFDSGVGGLAVLAEVRRLLPGEDIIYYADSAHFPYGSRPPEEVRARSEAVSRGLTARGAKLIMVACNTATSAAIAHLRDRLNVPFVGMEPALKPAAERTRTGVVALLVTPGTARGEKLASLIDRHGRDVRVIVIEAPGLAEGVERGEIEDPETRSLVRAYAREVQASGADVLALGCTHYAFLRDAFARELGSAIHVIEPSQAVAKQVARIIDEFGLRNPCIDAGTVEYMCSGDVRLFESVRGALMDKEAIAR
jgi:glutamate racemase